MPRWHPAIRRGCRPSSNSPQRSELLVGTKVAPMPRRQLAEHDAAGAHALESRDREPHQLAHATDLALPAFAQRESQLMLVLPRNARRLQLDAVELEAVLELFQAGRRERAFDAHEVFLLDLGVAPDQPSRDASVLGEDDEAGGVDIEPACGCETAQGTRLERDRRAVFGPAIFRTDQHARR